MKAIDNLLFNKIFNTEIYSDETYYQSIYRLEPGNELYINLSDHTPSHYKATFWDLKQLGPPIYYTQREDYIENFAELLAEALHSQISGTKNVAAEFSGGLDSSAIVAAALQQNLQPALFINVATPNSSQTDDAAYAQIVIDQLKIHKIFYIDEKNFNLEDTMLACAQYYAGAAPYIGTILNNNLHRAVVRQRFSLLLSGVGGDECASSHAPLHASIPEFIRARDYKKAWQEIYYHYHNQGNIAPHKLRRLLSLIKLAKPNLLLVISQFGDLGQKLRAYLKNLPYIPDDQSLGSLRAHEYNLLQGSKSHHLRMRVEYNAVTAKAMGFHYLYPLLYPKLVEFCYRLPVAQKRQNGINRSIMRDYLARFFPAELYGKHTKTGGTAPAILDHLMKQNHAGAYYKLFQDLPFAQRIINLTNDHLFRHNIATYMFKAFWDSYHK